MRKVLLALTAASMLTMSGCAVEEQKPAAPQISAGAKAALAAAEDAVKKAKAADALWTTADDALKKAKEAEKKGDSAAVATNAEIAKKQAELGMKQQSYPVLDLKNL